MVFEIAFLAPKQGTVDLESLQNVASHDVHQIQEPVIGDLFLLINLGQDVSNRSYLTTARNLNEVAPKLFLTLLFDAESEDCVFRFHVSEVSDDDVVEGDGGVEVKLLGPFLFFRPLPDELPFLHLHWTPVGNQESELVNLEKLMFTKL